MNTPIIARSVMPAGPGCLFDPLALAIAKARGWLPPTGHLIELSMVARDDVREAARVAMLGQPWNDAELWARDEHAEQVFGCTFNALSLYQQELVAAQVSRIVHAVRLYLDGTVEPLSDWRRAQVQIGAVTDHEVK